MSYKHRTQYTRPSHDLPTNLPTILNATSPVPTKAATKSSPKIFTSKMMDRSPPPKRSPGSSRKGVFSPSRDSPVSATRVSQVLRRAAASVGSGTGYGTGYGTGSPARAGGLLRTPVSTRSQRSIYDEVPGRGGHYNTSGSSGFFSQSSGKNRDLQHRYERSGRSANSSGSPISNYACNTPKCPTTPSQYSSSASNGNATGTSPMSFPGNKNRKPKLRSSPSPFVRRNVEMRGRSPSFLNFNNVFMDHAGEKSPQFGHSPHNSRDSHVSQHSENSEVSQNSFVDLVDHQRGEKTQNHISPKFFSPVLRLVTTLSGKQKSVDLGESDESGDDGFDGNQISNQNDTESKKHENKTKNNNTIRKRSLTIEELHEIDWATKNSGNKPSLRNSAKNPKDAPGTHLTNVSTGIGSTAHCEASDASFASRSLSVSSDKSFTMAYSRSQDLGSEEEFRREIWENEKISEIIPKALFGQDPVSAIAVAELGRGGDVNTVNTESRGREGRESKLSNTGRSSLPNNKNNKTAGSYRPSGIMSSVTKAVGNAVGSAAELISDSILVFPSERNHDSDNNMNSPIFSPNSANELSSPDSVRLGEESRRFPDDNDGNDSCAPRYNYRRYHNESGNTSPDPELSSLSPSPMRMTNPETLNSPLYYRSPLLKISGAAGLNGSGRRRNNPGGSDPRGSDSTSESAFFNDLLSFPLAAFSFLQVVATALVAPVVALGGFLYSYILKPILMHIPGARLTAKGVAWIVRTFFYRPIRLVVWDLVIVFCLGMVKKVLWDFLLRGSLGIASAIFKRNESETAAREFQSPTNTNARSPEGRKNGQTNVNDNQNEISEEETTSESEGSMNDNDESDEVSASGSEDHLRRANYANQEDLTISADPLLNLSEGRHARRKKRDEARKMVLFLKSAVAILTVFCGVLTVMVVRN